MKLEFSRQAAKALRSMQPKAAAAILEALERIAAGPFAEHANVERLRGEKDAFRLRHGDWRVPYRLDRETETMKVAAVKTRGRVYRR